METKEILEKQLELLSEVSKQTKFNELWDDLKDFSDRMVAIAQVLHGSSHNQSFYEASTNHPYVVQLPVEDLIDLYAARAQLLGRH